MESLPFEELCSSLADHVRRLEGERNHFTAPARHREVRAYLEENLNRPGVGTLRHHPFTWQGVEGMNLILEWKTCTPYRRCVPRGLRLAYNWHLRQCTCCTRGNRGMRGPPRLRGGHGSGRAY